MSAIIGAIRAVLSMDSAAFESGAKRAQATMGGVEKRMVQMAGRLEKAGRKAALGLTTPIVGAVSVAVKSSLSVIDAQAKMAQSLGTTVKSMQVLERAADLSGVSMGEVSQGVLQLTKRLSEVAATGKGPAAGALKALHLNAQELQKLPLDERLVAIQDALVKYVPEAERAAVATSLLGARAGIALTRIDSATLRTATQDVERFGVVVSEVDAEQIEVTNDAISRLGLVGRGVSNQLAAGLAPTLEFVANKAAVAAEWFAGLSDKTKQFIAGATALTAAAGPAALGISLLIKGALALRGAVMLATGPWGLLAGAVAAAGALYVSYRQNAAEAEQPLKEVTKAQEALSAAMGTFATTAAPQAGAAAIAAANDYYKMADAAMAAAEAEVAKTKASLDAAMALKSGQFDPRYRKNERDQAKRDYEDALAQLAAAQQALADAQEARTRTTAEVTSSGVKLNTVQDAINTKVDVAVNGTDKLTGSLKGLKDTTKGVSAELDGPLTSSVDGVSQAFGDWAAGGFRDIKSMWDAVKAETKRAIADVVATLAKNQLRLSVGLSVSGSKGGSSVTGGASGGSGLLSSLLGGGGFLGGLSGGVGIGVGNLITGGLGSYFGGIGAQAGMVFANGFSASALGGLMGMAAPLAVVGAILAKGLSRKYEFSGIRGNFTTDGFDGKGYDFYKGGFLRGNKTDYYAIDGELQAVLDTATKGVVGSIGDMSAAVGLSTRKLKGFVGAFVEVNTNQDPEAILEDLMEALTAAGSEMADLVLGTTKFTRAGETSLETLTRLSSGLSAVNDMADLLGQTALKVSLRGADAASQLVDLFGGTDAMATAAGVYFEAFYTEAEQNETIMRRLREQFAALNLDMPESRDGFRKLVEGLDLNSEAGRKLYAELLTLSGAMDAVLPQVAQFSLGMTGLLDQIGGEVGEQIDTARDMTADAKAAADLWYRTAGVLRDFKDGLLNEGLSAASGDQVAQVQKARLDTAVDLARAGDVQAAQDIPALARAYLQTAQQGASSSLEYRRIAAEVQGQLQFVAGLSDLQGANEDVLRGLYEQQIDVLTNLGNFLQLEGLTEAEVAQLSQGVQDLAADWDGTVAAFETSLGALEEAIRGAEAFSYDDLVGRLDVAVSLSENAPAWVQELVGAADTGIRTTLDFVVRRDDLTADMRWLAVNAVSEHVTAMDFVLRQDVDGQTRRLALAAGAELRRNIRFEMVKGLSADNLRVALAGSSELSRVVNVALGQADQKAVKLALGNIGSYAVAVSTSLSLGARVGELVFGGAGSYAVMVEGALTQLKGAARRVLLDQQGTYATTITAALAQDMPARTRALLINAATSAVRGVTVAMAFAETLTQAQRDLLLEKATAATRTISALVNPKGISAQGWQFLAQLDAAGGVNRTITGSVIYQKAGEAGDSLFAILRTAGTRVRDIRSAVQAAVMKGDAADLFKLLRTAGIATRDIRSEVKAAVMKGDASDLFKLLRTAGVATRDIRSEVKAAVMKGEAADLFKLLRTAGIATRDIRSEVKAAVMKGDAADLFKLLRTAGIATRDIRSEVKAAVMKGDATDLFKLLRTAGVATRDIRSEVKAAVMKGDAADLFTLLRTSGAKVRDILSSVTVGKMGKLESDMFAQLRAGKATIDKTLAGHVNLSGLTDRQKAMLDAISGVTKGTLTLGGSFTFTPAQAFSSLFADATAGMNGLHKPISGLTGMLDQLRGAVRDDIADRKAQANIATLNAKGVDLKADISGRKSGAAALIDKIEALEASTGAQLVRAGGLDAILQQNADGTISYKADWISGTVAGLTAFKKAFYGADGLEAQIFAYNRAIKAIPEDREALQGLRQQVRGLGGIPAFAAGGAHGGGWRVVGERGFELENTGPSRVISHAESVAMLDQRQVVARLDSFARQVSLQSQKVELIMKKIAQIAESWDEVGMPGVRV